MSEERTVRFLVKHYGNPYEHAKRKRRRERFDRFAEAAGNALAVGVLSFLVARAWPARV